ncbi:MAG: M48 family metalloprotease, partial [Halobacteria archaeon]|nr:M48 family metalloprotease [Halobacteria archaeon]
YALLAGVAFRMGIGLPIILAGSLLFVGFQYIVGKKVALWSVGAEDLPEEEYPEVHAAIDELCEDMDLEKPRVMRASMGVPNAFATGRKGAGIVVISDELMSVLNHEELKGVIAHELSHIKNRDVVMMVLGMSIAAMVGIAVRWLVFLAGDEDIADFFIGAIAGMIAQFLVMLFVLAISRYREYVADADAARYTGNGEALASALEKISSSAEGRESKVDDSVSALCIFEGDKGILRSLFATHPPMEKRIQRLRA